MRPLLAANQICLLFWMNFNFAINYQWTFRSIIDIATDILTSEDCYSMLLLLRQPITDYVSNNCIYFQSHMLCSYKLNCNRFNHHESPIFTSTSTISKNPPFCLVVNCALTCAFHVLEKICRIKIFIAIYFHVWIQYTSIIRIIRACQNIL